VTSQTGSVTFQNAGTWYDYFDGSTYTATGTAQSITLQPGEYHVYLNRNLNASVVTPVSAINALSNNLAIKVHPNPLQQKATIDFTVPETGNVQINVLDIMGQKLVNVQSGFLFRGSYSTDLDIKKNLPPGVYLLKLNTKTSTRTIEIVLQ
jgi:hypothetical protein